MVKVHHDVCATPTKVVKAATTKHYSGEKWIIIEFHHYNVEKIPGKVQKWRKNDCNPAQAGR